MLLFLHFVFPIVAPAANERDHPLETTKRVRIACLLRQFVRLHEPFLPRSSTLHEPYFFHRETPHDILRDSARTSTFLETCDDFLCNWGVRVEYISAYLPYCRKRVLPRGKAGFLGAIILDGL